MTTVKTTINIFRHVALVRIFLKSTVCMFDNLLVHKFLFYKDQVKFCDKFWQNYELIPLVHFSFRSP